MPRQIVTVKSRRRAHEALAKIEKLIAQHGFTGMAHISVIIVAPDQAPACFAG